MSSKASRSSPQCLIFPMLLLLFATKIASVRSTWYVTSSSQTFRPFSSATHFFSGVDQSTINNCQCRTTAFVARGNNCHPEKKRCYRRPLKQKYQTTRLKATQTSSPLNINDTTSSKQRNLQFSNPILNSRIRDLTSHPAVVWDESSTFASMHKKKLTRRHLHLFDRHNDYNHGNGTTTALLAEEDNNNNGGSSSREIVYTDDLFDQFATAVCHAGVVARKEVFETWASALYIYYTFLTDDYLTIGSSSSRSNGPIKRIVDVAAGHGLLAWALLLLSDNENQSNNDNNNNQQPLTVFCLDVQMPPSAELINCSMIQQWPHLKDRFDYVEARLEQLVPSPSCLLASVHACGILSDVLVATAAQHQIPLALVPCCHSRKRKLLEDCASPFAKREYDDILNAKKSLPNLADMLDEARMTALENAGCDVMEVFIPEIFTGKNRLIMGRPSGAPLAVESDDSVATVASGNVQRSSPPFRKGYMPPLLDDNDTTTTTTTAINPKARFMKGFYVPCEDTAESRDIVSSIAGRVAANKRKELMHNRNHVKAPQMDLSLWLPPENHVQMGDDDDDGVSLTEDSLSHILKTMVPQHVNCILMKLGEVYINPAGRKAQTFRIQYNHVDGESISFDEAKSIHTQLRDAVPLNFPGAECR